MQWVLIFQGDCFLVLHCAHISGVHGRRYITTHGLALNCDVDLKWFTHVVPCGIPDKGVTSLSSILKKHVSIEDAITPFLDSFSNQFSCNLNPLPIDLKKDIVGQLVLEKHIDSAIGQKMIDSPTWLN